VRPVVFVIAKPYDAEVIRNAGLDAGFEVGVLERNEDPCEQLARVRPAVVVLSTRLSHANAIQLLKKLRSEPEGREVPVILIGEAGSAMTPQEARRLGADHLLLRPIDPVLLVAKIDDLARTSTTAGGANGSKEIERRRRWIEARWARVCEGDYFSLLELEPDASSEEIQRAYQQVRTDLNPGQLPEQLAVELADKIEETLRVVEEAYRVLGNETLREAYREHLS
jgi:DNA-binding response OmpR family regulator